MSTSRRRVPPNMHYREHPLTRSGVHVLISCSSRIPTLIFDFLLLVLTLTKFHASLQGCWGRVSFATKFIQDGIWAYILPTSADLLLLS